MCVRSSQESPARHSFRQEMAATHNGLKTFMKDHSYFHVKVKEQGDCREETRKPIKFLFLPKMDLLGSQAPSDLHPHYGNGVFSDLYLLALDNTKR